MRIGFYFECFKSSGGVYQYALNLLDALKKNTEHSYVVFNISPDFPFSEFNLPNWKIINLISIGSTEALPTGKKSAIATTKQKLVAFVKKFIRIFHLYSIEIWLTTRNAKKRARTISREAVDIMFYHGPSELSFLTRIPSVVPIQDLQHRTNKGFPEVSKLGQWKKREYLYNHIKKNPYRILVDSEIGKEDIHRYYGIALQKITVLPPLPPSYIKIDISSENAKQVTAKFSLPEKFLFYPAQFWPHKNHLNLLKAVMILKNRNEIVPLALSGSGRGLWGTYGQVTEFVKNNHLENQVRLLGYVSNDEMSALYKLATGFIMSTYFGWTNIPLVEAWQMNCPAIYTNVRGCKEQAGDAALLIDPASPEDIAKKIDLFWNNPELRKELTLKGQKRLSLWTKKEYEETIKGIIDERNAELKSNLP